MGDDLAHPAGIEVRRLVAEQRRPQDAAFAAIVEGAKIQQLQLQKQVSQAQAEPKWRGCPPPGRRRNLDTFYRVIGRTTSAIETLCTGCARQ